MPLDGVLIREQHSCSRIAVVSLAVPWWCRRLLGYSDEIHVASASKQMLSYTSTYSSGRRTGSLRHPRYRHLFAVRQRGSAGVFCSDLHHVVLTRRCLFLCRNVRIVQISSTDATARHSTSEVGSHLRLVWAISATNSRQPDFVGHTLPSPRKKWYYRNC